MKPSAERRAMIALFAVFALMVQALVPSIASAGPLRPGEQMVCTDFGLQKITLGDTAPAKGLAHTHCDRCIAPPMAAGPPAMVAPAAVVAYTLDLQLEAAPTDLPPPARAPPRPPGQGPPTSNA